MNRQEAFQRVHNSPSSVTSWINLGHVLVHEGEIAEARNCFVHAVSLDPYSKDARDALVGLEAHQPSSPAHWMYVGEHENISVSTYTPPPIEQANNYPATYQQQNQVKKSDDGCIWIGLGVMLFILLLSPVDPVPDMIPVAGWLDDVGYITGLLYIISRKR